jgi:hypothetical protein
VGSRNFTNALNKRSKFLSFVQKCEDNGDIGWEASINGEGLVGCSDKGLRGGENWSIAGFSMQNKANFWSRAISACPCSKAVI